MSASLPLPLVAYRAGLSLLEPAAAGWLRWRQRQGLEDPLRLPERRGHAGRARPDGPLVHMHGASVGETLALLVLAERLAQRGLSILVTSGTRSSAALLAERLPPGALHQFLPLDVPRYVARFLDHWRPDLVLIAESELWPNLLLEADRRVIPLVLVNGRLSERSFRRWRRVPATIAPLLQRFALCLAQSRGDADRLFGLGAPRVAVSGNLKFDAPPPPADPLSLAQLSGLVAGRPVWLAASTHPGEEEAAIAAHLAMAARHPGLLTLLAPRHAARGAGIGALARAAGLATALRSAGRRPEREVAFYVADTVGELGLFYRLAPLAFVGGSLVPHGGQNPIEPAKLGSAILHGPHTGNFADIYALLGRAGAAQTVAEPGALGEAAGRLLADPGRLRALARAAAETAAGAGGAVERTLRAIEPYLPAARG